MFLIEGGILTFISFTVSYRALKTQYFGVLVYALPCFLCSFSLNISFRGFMDATAEQKYDYGVVRWFTVMAAVYLMVGALVGVYIASELAWPF